MDLLHFDIVLLDTLYTQPSLKIFYCFDFALSSINFIIYFRDLAINFLSSLHKYTFKDLPHVVELDLFDNQIDFLPETIFEDMDSLVNL